jgi:hypothetical protein
MGLIAKRALLHVFDRGIVAFCFFSAAELAGTSCEAQESVTLADLECEHSQLGKVQWGPGAVKIAVNALVPQLQVRMMLG